MNILPNFIIWAQCAREPAEISGSDFWHYEAPELLPSSRHILIDVWLDMKVMVCLLLEKLEKNTKISRSGHSVRESQRRFRGQVSGPYEAQELLPSLGHILNRCVARHVSNGMPLT